MKKEVLVRSISAVVLILLLYMTLSFWKNMGLFYLSLLFNLCVILEFQQVSLRWRCGILFRTLFVLSAILLVGVLCLQGIDLELRLGVFGLIITSFLALSIWLLKSKLDNEALLSTLTLSLMGFFYVSLLPSYALKLLLIPNGTYWFGYLLVSILAGDTFSYFGGSLWGKRKLYTQISPQKTIEGSLCGLFGSLFVFGIFYLLFPIEAPWPIPFGTVLVGAVFSQCGDLFESLVKRLGRQKDSSCLIPGHGGVLDRVDGIIFAAPVFFTVAMFL